MRQPAVTNALLLIVFVICSAPVLVGLVDSPKDTSNRFPETGAFIVWAGPNSAGFPEGLRAICTGALIHERVFLTAGHCVGPGVRGVPPFIQVAVSFDPANAFDRSSWVAVTRQFIHPSLPEECLSAPGCDPTTVGVFPAGDPARADLGVAILATPVRSIKPAVLARPGALTDARITRLPMTVVGYGSTQPIPRGAPPPLSFWDGVRRFRVSTFEKALNEFWGTWSLPSRVCFGDSGAPTFIDDPREQKAARRLVAVVSDGGIDCANTDARVRVDTAGVQEWIARVKREELGDRSSAQKPLPVIDMHLHASAADDNGPPPLALCVPPVEHLVGDPRRPWGEIFMEWQKKPPCPNPVWSPRTDDALMTETIAVLERRNVIGVLSGPPERVQQWRKAAPDRFIPGLQFRFGREELTPDSLRRLYAEGVFAVFAEVANQYVGITASDPRFEPYLATAEDLDVPVGIHVGTGPPGAPYLGFEKYRAALHSPLTLEDALIRHPKLRVYIMHAGWPMLDDLLAVLWTHPHVYVDVGGIVFGLPRAEFYRYLQRIVEAGFSKRVMFGSDQMVWPGVIEQSIQAIESAPFLSETQKRDILYNNASRFLRFSDADIARHHGR